MGLLPNFWRHWRGRVFLHCYFVSILIPKNQYAKLCPTLCDPIDCSTPGSSVYGILQAGIWSGLLFPSLGDLPDLGIEPTTLTTSALQADSVLLSHCGSRLSFSWNPSSTNEKSQLLVSLLTGLRSTNTQWRSQNSARLTCWQIHAPDIG